MLGVVVLMALQLPTHAAAPEPVCDGSESKLTASPDKRFTASVQEQVCSASSGRGAVAGITVILLPADAPQQTGRVAMTAVPRSHDEWPRVVWRSATALEVWVPNLAHVVEVKPGFRDVTVTLKYCGDNPEDRARVAQYQTDFERWKKDTTAWVERRKADPEQAGARPVRPEEPRLPRGVCTAADLPG
jgi:hypothetical protein